MICRLLLIAFLACIMAPQPASAQEAGFVCAPGRDYSPSSDTPRGLFSISLMTPSDTHGKA